MASADQEFGVVADIRRDPQARQHISAAANGTIVPSLLHGAHGDSLQVHARVRTVLPNAPESHDAGGTLPLVLLPGTLCDERVFAPLQERMPGVATRVVLTTGAESLTQAAEEVLAAAPEQFALLGFSLGGLVAIEVALRAPHRVRGLALLSSTPFAVDPAQHTGRRQAVAEAQRVGIGPFVRHHLWPSYTGVSESLPCPPLLEAMATTLGPAVFARQTEMALARLDVRPRLGEIRCPTLVLAGQGDRVCPPTSQHAFAAGLPGAVLTLLRDAGHFFLLEQPDETAANVAAWLNTWQQ